MPKIDAGIPFFPFQTTLDEKFELVEAEYGLIGFAVVIKLYQRIYSRGYYCDWTKEVELLFAKTLGLAGRSSVSEIVQCAIKRGIFDQALFDQYGILTSRGIQSRYFDATKKRKSVEAVSEYLLLPHTLLPGNVDIKALNSGIKALNSRIKRQRKGKERKGKESKEKDIGAHVAEESAPAPEFGLVLNDATYYCPSDEDIARWCALYPAVDVKQALRNMAGWCEANPRKRKTRRGIAAFIARWLASEQDKGGGKSAKLSGAYSGGDTGKDYGGEII